MADNFFDLDDSVNLFTIGAEIPSGAIIRGLGGQDLIVGSGNPDAIHGNTGADTLYGMDGNDTLQGGRGSDLLLGNRGDDLIFGERGNDVIFGGQGNDLLDGGVGDDFLAGDAGTDTLTGGDGSDAFVLDIRHGSSDRNLADVITDFSVEDGDVFAVTDGANDNLTEADLTLETVGTETFISLTATGEFLARVQGVTAEELTGTFSTVRATRDDTESGATVLNALPGQTSIQGQVGETDYQDFFELQVTETSIVDLSLTGLTADADLFLYQDLDADGELGGDEIISASSRWGNADEAIENVTLDQGRERRHRALAQDRQRPRLRRRLRPLPPGHRARHRRRRIRRHHHAAVPARLAAVRVPRPPRRHGGHAGGFQRRARDPRVRQQRGRQRRAAQRHVRRWRRPRRRLRHHSRQRHRLRDADREQLRRTRHPPLGDHRGLDPWRRPRRLGAVRRSHRQWAEDSRPPQPFCRGARPRPGAFQSFVGSNRGRGGRDLVRVEHGPAQPRVRSWPHDLHAWRQPFARLRNHHCGGCQPCGSTSRQPVGQ